MDTAKQTLTAGSVGAAIFAPSAAEVGEVAGALPVVPELGLDAGEERLEEAPGEVVGVQGGGGVASRAGGVPGGAGDGADGGSGGAGHGAGSVGGVAGGGDGGDVGG
jgi:hypothetical protein